MVPTDTNLSYKDAGVDIDAGNELVKRISADIKKTKRAEVQSNLGGFGALCSIPSKYKVPILVSATDGVGTKLRLAIDYNKHLTIGKDLVAMSVNDLVVQGAEPLFFLDYYATSKLDVDIAADVIKGIAEACIESGCALIGGETAEMPGIYQPNDYDLAGFCVGVVEEDEIIEPSRIRAGDIILALGSSGPHSNGYSLIRKILAVSKIDPEMERLDGKLLIEHLLEPTKIYVKSILQLIKQIKVNGIAHITGGGFWENIPRILSDNVGVILDEKSWQWPSIFNWLQQQGNITREEMYRTFNCGVGMIIIVAPEDVEVTTALLKQRSENVWTIGKVVHNDGNDAKVVIA